jgi:dipeptidase E
MKLLLASAGVRNPSIRAALVETLGKPIEECHALCVPTGSYGHPMAGPPRAWDFIAGAEPQTPMTELGWASLGVLELTALPSIPESSWLPHLQRADALLVGGGDGLYIHHWLGESGVAELVPTLDLVWVGLSAGSMVTTPRLGRDFVIWTPPGTDRDTPEVDRTLGWVPFSIFPHLDNPDLPENTVATAERWAASLGNPAYAIDDQTALRVVDGQVDVVSEGHWRRFPG